MYWKRVSARGSLNFPLSIVASYLSRGHGSLGEDHKDDFQVVLRQQLLEFLLATEQSELEGHLHPVIAQPGGGDGETQYQTDGLV